MRYIQDIPYSLKGKKVIIRIDVNEPINSEGYPQDDFRIKKALPTIQYFREKEAKIILIAHLGNPQESGKDGLSLRYIAKVLGELGDFPVTFIEKSINEININSIANLQDGEIVFLENIRFYAGEEANDKEFALSLAQLADIYINDAFSVSHREHASVSAITKYLPSFAGLQLAQEIEVLNRILMSPDKPAIAIIGGAKISTKLPVIAVLEEIFDYVLVGGKIANEYIDEYQIAQSSKIILPIDFIEDERYDIGPKTRQLFAEYIDKAATIVWNGPLGWFEQKPYDEGTQYIAEAIARNESSYSVLGGGETVDEIYNLHQESKIDFISTGGGAMLEYIAQKGQLPGIQALEHNINNL
jgi:phosphoglycerate kinase